MAMEQTREKMTRLRQTIATRLVEAQHTAAILTTFNEIDMSATMELRKQYKESFKERHNVNLGFMGFFTKAVIEGLKAFPRVNAQIEGDEIVGLQNRGTKKYLGWTDEEKPTLLEANTDRVIIRKAHQLKTDFLWENHCISKCEQSPFENPD